MTNEEIDNLDDEQGYSFTDQNVEKLKTQAKLANKYKQTLEMIKDSRSWESLTAKDALEVKQ